MTGKLARDVGRLLRIEREKLQLTQGRLATIAGIDQPRLSRLERGQGSPSTAVIERAFEALGQQVTLDLEPIDGALDARIAAHTGLTEAERVEVTRRYAFLLSRLVTAGLDFRFDGTFGAFLHGVSVEADVFGLAFTAAGAGAFVAWLRRIPNASRWNDRHRDYIDGDSDPMNGRPNRWGTPAGEIRARILDRLPEPIHIEVGGTTFPVLPLPDIAAGNTEVDRVLTRLRQRGQAAGQLGIGGAGG